MTAAFRPRRPRPPNRHPSPSVATAKQIAAARKKKNLASGSTAAVYPDPRCGTHVSWRVGHGQDSGVYIGLGTLLLIILLILLLT